MPTAAHFLYIPGVLLVGIPAFYLRRELARGARARLG